jgi:hypothetical protein
MWSDVTNEVYSSAHVQVNTKIHYKDQVDPNADPLQPLEGELPTLYDKEWTDEYHEQEYVPSEIIDEVFDEDGNRRYKVRWEGYDEDGDTLETYENVKDLDIFKEWEVLGQSTSAFNVVAEDTPTLQQAMKRADRELWLAAMEEEHDSLLREQTWTIVPRPKGRKVISAKWVLRIKWDVDRKLPTYKARFCARGFTQIQDVDYDDTFSPTLSKTGLRLILAVAVQLGMHIHTVDCKNAFLNGEIDKEIYIEQPQHFEQEGTSSKTHVCKLNKALYGLKQSPHIWCKTLQTALGAGGFEQMEYEPCIFIKRSKSSESGNKRMYDILSSLDELVRNPDFCIMGVYVDDITIMSTSVATIQKAKKLIEDNFMIKDQGRITRIIGMEVEHFNNGLVLTQKSYLREVVAKQGMEKCNGNRIPLEPGAVGTLTGEQEGDHLVDNHWYRSIVGELLYATVCTRPDLSFVVNLCARNVEKPTERHRNAIKKILRYVKSSLEVGLVYKKSMKDGLRLIAYSDSDFSTDKTDSKSTTGYVVTLNGCTISWCTGKQKAVSTSTVEAEYIAACAATKEVIWLHYLLTEILGCVFETPLLLLDNAGAEALTQNEGVSNKTKHIRYSHHYIRNCHENKMIVIRHIAGTENPADMFTKPLCYDSFSRHCKTLRVETIHSAMVNVAFANRGYFTGNRKVIKDDEPHASKRVCWEK